MAISELKKRLIDKIRKTDVRKMLGISHGTVQNPRIKGVLPYQKLGGVMFYRYAIRIIQPIS